MAQYFGQNKVQFHSFDFKVLHTQHFDIYYYPAEKNPATLVGQMAERWYQRLSTFFGWQLTSTQPIVLYANSADFRSTTVIPGFISEGTGGVTEGLRRRIVMPIAGSMAETDHVLGHELVHAFQFDISAKTSPRGNLGMSMMNRLPLWFVEGLAEYLSIGPEDPNTAMWMRSAVLADKLPAIKDLDHPKYFPYRWGEAFWAYVGGRWGDEAASKIFKLSAESGSAGGAIQSVIDLPEKEVSEGWQQALKTAYEPVLRAALPVKQQAQLLIGRPNEKDSLNVSPAVSPDGKFVVYFSSRDLFAVNAYLADASTGRVIRRLTSTALNPHIGGMDFINSTGAWSADGKLFAYGLISGGSPQVDIYDIQKRRVVRRIKLKSLGEILGLSWSPDGSEIVISGKSGGVTNLFVLTRATGALRQLTNDHFTELQPAWSPDGSRIAFVTDRFTSSERNLYFGKYRLGLIDPRTGQVQPIDTFPTGKSINPQWSPDGRSLYFISDRDGIDNLYRVFLADGTLRQMTNLEIGISGITALSPAISVARETGRILFSVYEDGGYLIYRLNSQPEPGGSAPSEKIAALHAALLPPRTSNGGMVAAYLRQPEQGLAAAEAFTTTQYESKLQLQYLAPPTFTAGMSSYGAMVGGGIALYFGDMLNNRQLMIATQSTSYSSTGVGHFYNNLSGVAAFVNQKHRWHWGFSGGQIPFLSGFQTAGPGPVVDGNPTAAFTDIYTWEINRQATGSIEYPFNRAMRVGFSGGFQRFDFDAEARQVLVNAAGNVVTESKIKVPTPSGISLATASTALVYDNSIFGGTGPIMGQRYRLELGGNSGTLNFADALVDYRRYLHLAKPVILAGRLMHYGRYGGEAEDSRLSDLYLGYPGLVRGYQTGSFTPADCGPQVSLTGECPLFERMVGSRIAVVNAELRTPLLGALGIIPSRGYPPVTNAAFYDAGVAWTSHQKAYFLGGPLEPVRSFGDTMRVNVFGFAVLDFSAVKPVDRPHKGWMFEFDIVPGF